MNHTADPVIFEKLLAPLKPKLSELNQQPLSQTARKLCFALFVRLLLFRLFARIKSLRELVRDLQSNSVAEVLVFPTIGLSTFHDAFVRYPVSWFVELSQYLLKNVPITEISEVAGLGVLWCVDSSFWPLVRSLSWAKRQGLEGVRLHLGLSLNILCPVFFLMTLDKSPTSTERTSLLHMAEAGVTYILDRGYVDLKLYFELMAREAYFVVRERNNLCCQLCDEIHFCLDPGYGFLQPVTDHYVRLDRDSTNTLYRLVHFVVAGHTFQLLTNRFDLTTQQVILLYAWRWQIELIFRAWKHTFGALHVLNLSEAGIEIQFHILLIASLLWVAFHQEVAQVSPQLEIQVSQKRNLSPPVTPTGSFGKIFQVSWRLSKPLLHLLHNCLARPFSCYLGKLAQLQL